MSKKHIPPTPPGNASRTQPHTGWGIASFALAIIVILIEIAAIITVSVLHARGAIAPNSSSPVVLALGIAIFGSAVLNLVGIVLGIIGAAARERNRLFAALGLALNVFGLIFVAIVLLVGWGVVSKAQ